MAAKVAIPGGSLPEYIIFTPDGTVADDAGVKTGFTIFLRDRSSVYHGKVLVFGTTGYAYNMGQW
ncbi:MAG: hypothetical protein JRH20_29840 [Deltaproteobacteria bacterium]|nr:hypothetical protein [Deltaproteobacteria bacterium]